MWFSGPSHQEHDSGPNPFLDYRLTVTFTGPTGQAYHVPGYFDGDGQGGGQGTIWKAILAPDEIGTWSATASFRYGPEVAISLDPQAGTPTAFDGQSTSFNVASSDGAEGFLDIGRLEYVGEHYLKFADGDYFLKGGIDSPENLLAYAGFDDTYGGNFGLHYYPGHIGDWNPGDPDFSSNVGGNDGRALIGALNYLGSQRVNSVYFLPMNLGGDGQDTWPFLAPNNERHYDISKMGQWRAVFDHAAKKSILLHFVLAETESANEQWLDNGNLGVERKLFYRELVARFAHVPAIKWNLSEENDYQDWLLRDFADYIDAQDVYDHPIAVHNHLNYTGQYQNLAGDSRFDATSAQYDPDQAGSQVELFRSMSAAAGRRWVVEMDENAPASTGLAPWNAADLRKRVLWDVYFSGGAGIEWYCGGDDQSLEDFSSREEMWRYMYYARGFMQRYVPFWLMQPADGLLSGESGAYGGGEVFALQGSAYAVYLPSASQSGVLDMSASPNRFEKSWYNPRTGQFEGNSSIIFGGGPHDLGPAPTEQNEDWVVLFRRAVPLPDTSGSGGHSR